MPSPPIPDSPVSSVFAPAESLIVLVSSLILFLSLCPLTPCLWRLTSLSGSVLLPQCPLLDLSREGYAFYQPLRVCQRGFKLWKGVGILGGGGGARRRDEIESDRADEVEEGGAEIKLNTK